MKGAFLGFGGAVVAAVAGTVVVFGGGGGGTALSATITVANAQVERTSSDNGTLAARTGDQVTVGDRINTDTTGRAQLDYSDGSFARLGPDTELTIVELDRDAGRRAVRSRLNVGETWHRVTRLTGRDESSDEYVVRTAVASAAVRGTAFAVVCPVRDRCTFTVIEGEVEINPRSGPPVVLGPGETITVTASGATDAVTLSPDQLRDDAWIAGNLALDADLDDDSEAPGDDEVASAAARRDAVIAGNWDMAMVTVASPDGERDGEHIDRRYQFILDDCDDTPCALVAHLESGAGDLTVPMTFDGDAYHFQTTFTLPCDNVDDAIRTTLSWRVAVSDATPDEIGWRATDLSGTVTEQQAAERPSSCRPGTLRHELTGSRP